MNLYASPARASTVSHGNAAEPVPADLDPGAHPSVEPLRPVGPIAAEVVASLRRQRQIEHVHRLGARAVGELLREVDDGADLDHALAAYERLTPELLKATGGDRFPAQPIHVVRS